MGGVPKQYQHLGGQALLRHSIQRLRQHPDVDAVHVVIHADHRALYDAAIAGLALPPPIIGGTTRQASVLAGQQQIERDGGCDAVLIHDGARPFPSDAVISHVLAALATSDGAAPALPVVDSLRQMAPGQNHVLATHDRTGLHQVQTPQGFRFCSILSAHQTVATSETDDVAVAMAAGLTVALTPGDHANFKVTDGDDMARAERQLQQQQTPRTAMGYDVHRFGPGDHIWLCGIKIAHGAGIIAHSDGDVALHALTDALLGCISGGDIGSHFPPSDLQWKDAPSATFLVHARNLITARGGRIVHVDLTVVAERPKVGPYREQMRAHLAQLLEIDASRVSVKATTTEGLGFTGRGEGIAAHATATVLL